MRHKFCDLCVVKLAFPHTEVFDRATSDFNATALEIFRFQYAANDVYRRFCDSFRRNPDNVALISDIPFLPVEFFKSHMVYCGDGPPEIIFTSSGTTGSTTSKHEVFRRSLYVDSFLRGFMHTYGDPANWIFLFLLPSYLEREGSSLVYMAQELKNTGDARSGFYLYNYASWPKN